MLARSIVCKDHMIKLCQAFHLTFVHPSQAREGDASSREALLKVRLLLCRSLGLTPTNTNGIWELALPLSIATIVAAAAEGGSGAPSSGVAERLQLKHAFMASSADVPNSKAWLRACLEVKFFRRRLEACLHLQVTISHT